MTAPLTTFEIAQLRTGQKWVILAIVLGLANLALRLIFKESTQAAIVASGCAILGIGLGVIGMLRITTGLRYPLALRVGLCFVALLPFANIVTLAVVNKSALRVLKESAS